MCPTARPNRDRRTRRQRQKSLIKQQETGAINEDDSHVHNYNHSCDSSLGHRDYQPQSALSDSVGMSPSALLGGFQEATPNRPDVFNSSAYDKQYPGESQYPGVNRSEDPPSATDRVDHNFLQESSVDNDDDAGLTPSMLFGGYTVAETSQGDADEDEESRENVASNALSPASLFGFSTNDVIETEEVNDRPKDVYDQNANSQNFPNSDSQNQYNHYRDTTYPGDSVSLPNSQSYPNSAVDGKPNFVPYTSQPNGMFERDPSYPPSQSTYPGYEQRVGDSVPADGPGGPPQYSQGHYEANGRDCGYPDPNRYVSEQYDGQRRGSGPYQYPPHSQGQSYPPHHHQAIPNDTKDIMHKPQASRLNFVSSSVIMNNYNNANNQAPGGQCGGLMSGLGEPTRVDGDNISLASTASSLSSSSVTTSNASETDVTTTHQSPRGAGNDIEQFGEYCGFCHVIPKLLYHAIFVSI